jgi:PAS domain S-box-containing protein
MAYQNDYEWLFRKAPVMTTSIAEDGTYLDVNDAMLERLGYELEDMVGRKPEAFATPETYCCRTAPGAKASRQARKQAIQPGHGDG